MIINHNIPAMNTNRQLSVNDNHTSKSLEKLSSGMRINKAGDDAAGLAISEKMRGQIRGLDMATKNAQDDISLIQTAEGSLTAIEDILQRMRELAVQSSNDSNVSSDRGQIQLEINALSQEITRISNDTEFNTQKLLNSNFENKKFHIGANQSQSITVSIDRMSASALNVSLGAGSNVQTTHSVNASGVALKLVATTTSAKVTAGSYTASISYKLYKMNSDGKWVSVAVASAKKDWVGFVSKKVLTSKTAEIAYEATQKGMSLSSQVAANRAITIINNAIESVSTQRAKLGAIQNRLEYTIQNLEVASENTSAAESRIRDVDMSKEMMAFTKNNILSQAATAMLAQANQMPQNVLSLLR